MSIDEAKREEVRNLAKKLEAQLGVNVGAGYGFPENFIGVEPEYFLMVFSDDDIDFPSTFEGYRVVLRGVPRAY